MFIYLNALKNLLRNKGRNILVSVILLIAMTATTVSLAIRSTSEAMIENYQEGFGVETMIVSDWDYLEDHAQVIEEENPDGSISTSSFSSQTPLPLNLLMEFADSQYVQDVQVSASAQYVSDNLQSADDSDDTVRPEGMTLEELLEYYGNASRMFEDKEFTRNELIMLLGGGEAGEKELERLMDSKKNVLGVIEAYSDASLMTDFRIGEKKLTSGRLFENDGEVVISEEFAKKNNLNVGDIITVSGASQKYDTDTLQLTVVGIFKDVKAYVNSKNTTEIPMSKNDMITSFGTLFNSGFHTVNSGDELKYFLTDAEVPELFLAEIREKGLPMSYKLDSNVEGYNQIVEPVKKMSSVATTYGIVVFLIGAVILVFLSVINIRERKYEVGVLRAIGMKKHQLARGMIYESLSLVMLCTVIGLPIGILLAKPISGMLLETADNVSVSLNPAILPLLLLVAVGLGIISSLIGILYITKYEPMKILQERN